MNDCKVFVQKLAELCKSIKPPFISLFFAYDEAHLLVTLFLAESIKNAKDDAVSPFGPTR